jgi:hypothetical protein
VLSRVEVLCGVTIRARIATTHVSTDEALPKVNPGVAGSKTILATLRRGLHVVVYLVQVAALLTLEHPHEPPHRLTLKQLDTSGGQGVGYRSGGGAGAPEQDVVASL